MIPTIVEEIVRLCKAEPYHLERVPAETINEVVKWLHDKYWLEPRRTAEEREHTGYRLLAMRWAVDQGRITDGAVTSDQEPSERGDGSGYPMREVMSGGLGY